MDQYQLEINSAIDQAVGETDLSRQNEGDHGTSKGKEM